MGESLKRRFVETSMGMGSQNLRLLPGIVSTEIV